MSKIQVDAIEQQTACGTTLTAGGGAGKTVVVDATTVTLGRCGGTVALASGASQTGFGRTGTVDWITTPKTATFTAVSGEGYFCNTSGGAFTVNLPAGVAGAIISLADYAATWQTSNVTVTPNGTDKIGSLNDNAVLSTEGQSVTFVYVDSTQGWINTMDSTSNVRGQPPFICASVSGACNTLVTAPDCANMKVATFTGPGTFTVNSTAACAADDVVSYMVIAGGGGSGTSGAGGGGAGGYREVVSPSSPYTGSPLNGYPSAPNRITVTAAAFPITVGGGGAGLPVPSPIPGNGGARGGSSIFSSITSTGGGGSPSQTVAITPAGPGGSGAGLGKSGTGPAGVGNTPPVSPAQGTNGSVNGPIVGGGGGGAGGAGGPGGNLSTGGVGTTSSINGTPTARAGGGGGGSDSTPTPGGPGGPGGGGQGGNRPDTNSTNGTSNTGGGAGGTGECAPGGTQRNGGSGIVIIRYKFQ
jgi:hypothetical protein